MKFSDLIATTLLGDKNSRRFLFYTSLSLALINTGLILLTSIAPFLLILTLGVILAVVVASFILISIPGFREAILSHRKLLRLDNLTHPLLSLLQQKATGSFQHSLNVALLAYRATKAIGGDAFLARIGAYYHDIGKTANPELFAENQKEAPRQARGLDIEKKIEEVKDHVTQGIALAKEYNLPKEVIDFIPEHHGTTKIYSLYEEAKRLGKKINLENFHYPGPKPLSKETAIVMLADTVEAKSRLFPKLTREIIASLVDETIEEKLNDGQLELSSLSAADLKKIREVFVGEVPKIFHQRVVYYKKSKK